MAKSMTNLSIRVNLPEEKDYKVKEEVVILWDRIIFFVGAVIVFLALVVGGVIWFVSKDNTAATLGSEQEAAKPAVLNEEPVGLKAEVVKPPVTLKASEPASVQAAIGLGDSTPVVAIPKPVAAISQPAAIVEPVTVQIQAAIEQQAPNPVMEAPAVIASVKEVRQSGPLAQVVKESEHLLRAVLATAMKGREPADKASSVLYVPKDQLLTVYFFTELQGLGKQEIHYEWFRNDKRAARVRVRPRYDTTDNYSSKYINYNMRGNWRVTAKTAQGELLATANFEVR